MRIRDIPEYLESTFDYPVSQATVLERAGQTVVDAPDEDESETITEILEPLGEQTYHSTTELFEEIQANLSDDYIGRKFYDDRGGTLSSAPLAEDDTSPESI